MDLPVMSLSPFFSFTIHVILLLFMNLLGSESAMAATFKNETDRLALLEFKYALTHDPLGVLSSWNDSLHFCQWQGVTCSRRHPRVTVLDMEGAQVGGTISPYIGNLTFLRSINLANNSFYGGIPQEVGRLFRLREIKLNNNSFGGEIPSNLSRCSNIVRLDLSYNYLEQRIPFEIGSLSKLVTLFLYYNYLTGEIPVSLGNLSSLQQLSLSWNNLKGHIPEALGRITSMTFFKVAVNSLSGMIPPSFYNLSSIEVISLTSNKLYGSLRPEIGLALPNLQAFLIGNNQFTGPIPVSLSNASGLQELDMGSNNFTGNVPLSFGHLRGLQWFSVGSNHLGSSHVDDLSFLTSLSNCSNLQVLDICINHFGGVLPNSIANLSTQLTGLILGTNQIVGSIPTGIENLINLGLLDMRLNFLSGDIPASIGKLPKLQKLYLNANKLSGQIPSSLGNVTQLIEVYLFNNSLEGSIPSSLGNCQHLQALYLCHNKLSGTIPKQLIGLPSLSITLNLSHNSLTGSLPLEVGNLINLGSLDVSYNRLSGEIPSTLGDCLSLEHLFMQGNFFQGTIPSSLSALKAIQDFDLSHNKLSGEIPKYMESFSLLQYLNLSSNDLEGEVPTQGVFKNASAVSVSGNSKLCGGILELQLHPCPRQESRKQGKSIAYKLIMVIVIVVPCLILMLALLTVYWIRWSRKIRPLLTHSFGHWYPKISYEELHKATDGFCPGNLIGSGNFGTVYKGILNQDEITVAVKVLNLHQRGGSKSFMAECEALRNIRHRNLVKVITACSSADFGGNDFKALVFEFMPNGSLEKWLHPEDGQIRLRSLNFRQRIDVAIDVASALVYLHHHCQIPIIHCDLKPSNILLDNDMVARLGDFGLARLLKPGKDSSQNQFSSLGIKGSIGYAAPEYGMGGELSIHGDVYSYGILLLEMFTGKKPTDNLFKDGLNLHNFVKAALSEHVIEVVDPSLLSKEEVEEIEVENTINNIESCSSWRYNLSECLISVFRIAVACSAEPPRQRMDMREVAQEMHLIHDNFLGAGVMDRPTMAQLVGVHSLIQHSM